MPSAASVSDLKVLMRTPLAAPAPLSRSLPSRKESRAATIKEGGPPTPKRPAHCFLTYPNSRPLSGREIQLRLSNHNRVRVPGHFAFFSLKNARLSFSFPPRPLSSPRGWNLPRVTTYLGDSAVFFFCLGSVHNRTSNSAKFLILVRLSPSTRAASRKGEATPLRSS